jgi:parallel beta-helix repeat protein
VNGDGYSDVIVGAHAYDNGQNNEGRAYVYHGSATGLSTSFAWTAESNQTDAYFGWSVASAGDVNGDGYSDVIVGARAYDNGETDEGRAYVYHGSATGLSASSAWTAESNQSDASFGYSVANAGDVNGDGYSDVIVGAYAYDNGEDGEGRAYLYHGSATGLLTGPAWTAEGNQTDAYFGRSVASAGDVNGDGYSDVIVGARAYDGRAYVYHGSATGLSTSFAWTAEGNQTEYYFGWSVASAGDVNGDGYSDVIVGVFYSNDGIAYVYHGSATGLSTSFAWTAESNQSSALEGWSVASAGDVNGDGYSDVIVGAHFFFGRAYVYHGSATGLSTSSAWTAESKTTDGHCGWSVASAGDVNGDGYSDVIVGAIYHSHDPSDDGRVFVYHGNGGSGLSLIPAQRKSDNSAPIAHLGRSDSMHEFRLTALGRTPYGRSKVKLEWEVKPLGTPFDGTGTQKSASWTDTGTAGANLNELVSSLTEDTCYHWRMRLLYHPASTPFQQHSRWLSSPWNGPEETDLRTPAAPTSCTCGDICVDETGWWRDGGTLNETGWWRDGGTLNASTIPIQAAVDNANAGETICVKAGSYTENVNITTPHLTLAGEGAGVVTVTAASSSDHVFDVTADYVNISGFNATGATNSGKAGIYLGSNVDHCNISENNCSNNNYGIYLNFSSNNTLANNTANSNYGANCYGIYLSSSSNNTLLNNTANSNYGYTNGLGIYLMDSSNNTLTNNTANSNYGNCGYGIYLSSSSNNTLTNNTANSNDGSVHGLGIYLMDSSNNTLTNNTANSNYGDYGCGIWLYSSSNNTLANNTANLNSGGEGGSCGIWLYSSSNNTLASNNATSNGYGYGISIGSSSNYNTLTSNNASNNYRGIYLYSSSNNTLANNTASNGDYGCGIYLWSSSNNTLRSSSNNTLTNNNCSNNTQWDIYIEGSDSTFTNNTLNGTTISFTYRGDVSLKGVGSPAADPAGQQTIGKFVSATNQSTGTWLFINFSYSDADVSGLDESDLAVWKHNGTMWLKDGWNGARYLDSTGNIVGVNITSFSVFAPAAPELPDDITPPVITITTPAHYELYTVGMRLNFLATDSASGVDTIAGNLTNTSGVSQIVDTRFEPEVGVYTLVATATDNAGNTNESDPVFFVVYDPAGGRATGKGWFYPDVESTHPGGKADFKFTTSYKKDVSTGKLDFKDKDADIKLKGKSIDWLVISSVSAQFQGTGTINGEGLYTFRVQAKDNGKPGAGNDHFDIMIWKGIDTMADPDYKAKNTIADGDIKVHAK